MRFLVDECTGVRVAGWLRKEGYQVFSVYEQARGIIDDLIIQKAFDEDWILITKVLGLKPRRFTATFDTILIHNLYLFR